MQNKKLLFLSEQLRKAYFESRFERGMNLPYLAAKSLFDTELEQSWQLFLKKAKEQGYKKITVGACDHWPNHSNKSNMVFAEPKRTIGQWPALWFIDDALGGHVCGNGLPNADQVQLQLNNESMMRYVGEHIL